MLLAMSVQGIMVEVVKLKFNALRKQSDAQMSEAKKFYTYFNKHIPQLV